MGTELGTENKRSRARIAVRKKKGWTRIVGPNCRSPNCGTEISIPARHKETNWKHFRSPCRFHFGPISVPLKNIRSHFGPNWVPFRFHFGPRKFRSPIRSPFRSPWTKEIKSLSSIRSLAFRASWPSATEVWRTTRSSDPSP